MADRGLCPECGSAALLEDAHYAQQQLVCAACGCVLAEGLLTTTYSDEGQLRGEGCAGGDPLYALLSWALICCLFVSFRGGLFAEHRAEGAAEPMRAER